VYVLVDVAFFIYMNGIGDPLARPTSTLTAFAVPVVGSIPSALVDKVISTFCPVLVALSALSV
jgi:hypothetical protein